MRQGQIIGAISVVLTAAVLVACNPRHDSTASLECNIHPADSLLAETFGRTFNDSTVWYIFDPSCPACNDLLPHIVDLSATRRIEYVPTAIVDHRSLDAVVALDFAKESGHLIEMLEYQHMFFLDHRRAPRVDEMIRQRFRSDETGEFQRFVSAPTRRLEHLRLQNKLVAAGIRAVPAVLFRQRVLTGNNLPCLDVLLGRRAR